MKFPICDVTAPKVEARQGKRCEKVTRNLINFPTMRHKSGFIDPVPHNLYTLPASCLYLKSFVFYRSFDEEGSQLDLNGVPVWTGKNSLKCSHWNLPGTKNMQFNLSQTLNLCMIFASRLIVSNFSSSLRYSK